MFEVVDVGHGVLIAGEVVTFPGLHAVKAKTIITQPIVVFSMKHLVPFIFWPFLF